jgi:hypothetical protein
MAYDTPKAAHFEAYDYAGEPIEPHHNALWYAGITARWSVAHKVQDTVTGNMLAVRMDDIAAIDAILDKHNASDSTIVIRLAQSVREIAARKGYYQ